MFLCIGCNFRPECVRRFEWNWCLAPRKSRQHQLEALPFGIKRGKAEYRGCCSYRDVDCAAASDGISLFISQSAKGSALSGALSLGAYWIVIWAMSVAPIGMVAALRETSVLFAALMSALVLREPLTRWRAVAAALIVVGMVVTRVA